MNHVGIGGVIRLHFGEHFRVGSEGYVSTLSQLDDGSYLKYGWGGILADFYSDFGRFQPARAGADAGVAAEDFGVVAVHPFGNVWKVSRWIDLSAVSGRK